MKVIYLAACLLFFTLTAVSQSKPLTLSLFPELDNNAYLFQDFKKQPQLEMFQSLISGIQILPQDNMPCFVPNISSMVPIPTLKSSSPGQTIPNPYMNPGLSLADPK